MELPRDALWFIISLVHLCWKTSANCTARYEDLSKLDDNKNWNHEHKMLNYEFFWSILVKPPSTLVQFMLQVQQPNITNACWCLSLHVYSLPEVTFLCNWERTQSRSASVKGKTLQETVEYFLLEILCSQLQSVKITQGFKWW